MQENHGRQNKKYEQQPKYQRNIVGINPSILLITLKLNYLNTPTKDREKSPVWIKK